MRRQTPEHDGLTLLLLPRFPSVVLIRVVAIGVVPIFWPITVSSLPFPLLLVGGNICGFSKLFFLHFILPLNVSGVVHGRGTYLWAVSGSSAIVEPIISSLVTPATHVISLLVPFPSVTPVGIVAGLVGPVPPASFRAANPGEGRNGAPSASYRYSRVSSTF